MAVMLNRCGRHTAFFKCHDMKIRIVEECRNGQICYVCYSYFLFFFRTHIGGPFSNQRMAEYYVDGFIIGYKKAAEDNKRDKAHKSKVVKEYVV